MPPRYNTAPGFSGPKFFSENDERKNVAHGVNIISMM